MTEYEPLRRSKLLDLYTMNKETHGFLRNLHGGKEYQTQVLHPFLEVCHLNDDALLLDLGCGLGEMSDYIEEQNLHHKVIRYDLSEAALSSQQGKRIRGFADKLPFESNIFDAIVCKDVLVHMVSKPQFFSEFARILKPEHYGLVVTQMNYVKNEGIRFGFLNRRNELKYVKAISEAQYYCVATKLTAQHFRIFPPYTSTEHWLMLPIANKYHLTCKEQPEWIPAPNADWHKDSETRGVWYLQKT